MIVCDGTMKVRSRYGMMLSRFWLLEVERQMGDAGDRKSVV